MSKFKQSKQARQNLYEKVEKIAGRKLSQGELIDVSEKTKKCIKAQYQDPRLKINSLQKAYERKRQEAENLKKEIKIMGYKQPPWNK